MDSIKAILWCGMAATVLANAPARAADSDDAKLQTETQRIDNDKSATTDTQKIDALAKQFNVPAATVQDLRSKGQGWGEITIGLAEAQQLSKSDPKTYPTISDALNKVETLRASGEGWGKIAKDLGFKLGPVISAAHHARHELNETSQQERAEHEHQHQGELGHHDRPDHPERPDRSERPDRPGH